MHTNTHRPSNRPAAVATHRSRATGILGAASLALAGAMVAVPAHATPTDSHSDTDGKATAVAARTKLDVSVLNGVHVPVTASLNAVSAPEDAENTLLTAEVEGAHNGNPVKLVKAKVAHSSATAEARRSAGEVKLVGLRAYAPGLLTTPLLKADLLKANATCVAGEQPTARAELANVTVLGETVTVNAGSPTKKTIKVPGVGSVNLSVEQTTTTDSTGAATALKLSYEVNPANLGVVKASGEITLAEATCTTPTGGGSSSGGSSGTSGGSGGSSGTSGGESGGSQGGSGSGGNQPTTQTGDSGTDLAKTGGSSSTGLIAGVGAAVLAAGGGTLYLVRRRGAARGSD